MTTSTQLRKITPQPMSVIRDTKSGFRAQLTNQSLADLIQMECNSGSQQAVQVISQGRVGYLFFDGGSLIHAECGAFQGEPALRQMLAWNAGEFKRSQRPRPTFPTISDSWQAVLIRAAQAQDEAAVGGVIAADFAKAAPVAAAAPVASVAPKPSTTPETTDTAMHEATTTVRLDAAGNVLATRGDTGELAEVIAYVTRLAQLVGEELALEELAALESVVGGKICIAFFAQGGWTAKLLEEGAEAADLRRNLKLV